ncbi:YhdP family phospholipid transporter [Thiolapillus sp.]
MTRLFQLLCLIVLLIATAKVLIFGFALYAENNKQTIERWASSIVGTQVRFSNIETYWAGITPQLWVRQLSLGEEEKLTLGDTLVGINLGALPRWQKNLPINVHLKGTHIQVLRDAAGKMRIPGLLQSVGSDSKLPTYVFFEDATIELQDEKRGARIHQGHLSVKLFTRGDHSSLSIYSPEQGLQVRAEIDGSISGGNWSGLFWSQGRSLQTEQLLQAYLPEGYLLNNLQLNFQAWSYWEQGRHRTTRALIDLDEVNLHLPEGAALKLTGLQGDLLYEKHNSGWKLQLKDFRMNANAHQWQDTGMAMQVQQGELLLGISQIDLQGAAKLLPLLPQDNKNRKLLEALSPGGLLSSLRASIDLKDLASTPVIRSKFNQLSFQPLGDLPGISNFSGNILLRKDLARLRLDTQHAQIRFNTLFRQPLPLRLLQGEIEWRKDGVDSWILHSEHLLADSPDLQTISRLRVEKTAGNPPVMDIQTDFRNGNGKRAGLYYPAGIMPDNLVAWLDAAIVSGSVPQGSFLFYGPLARGHFPFDKTHDGHFEVLFDVNDLQLAYQNQWPPLTGTSASVRFHNNSLSIRANRARIYQTQVRRATAGIASLHPISPLRISGKTTGPMADYLRLLRETPLKHTVANRVKGLSVAGNADLQLQLKIPLAAHPTPPEFDLAVDFKQEASLFLASQQLLLGKLQGQLKINNQGLFADDIQATAMDTDISLSIKPARNATLVEAQGRIPAQGLLRQYPRLAPLQLQGAADVDLSLTIPGLDTSEATATRLQIRSTLEGMAMDMPAPLGKTAEQSTPLRLDMQLGDSFTSTTVKYGDILGITFKQDSTQGDELLAKVSALPLRSWLHHFSGQSNQDLSSIKLKHIRLETEKLDASPLITSSFLLDLNHSEGKWKGQISSDNISGSVAFSDDLLSQPLVLDLDKLHLQTATEKTAKKPEASTEKLLPGDFPAIRLSSKNFVLNKAKLGTLELLTSRQADAQTIEKLEAHGKLADISVHGSWEYSAGSGTTWLKGVVTTDNMGKLLKKALHMDFLSGSKTYLSFDLSWAGAPFQPNIEQMQGEAQLDMAQGRFLHFKPGLARILGLVNFDTLLRRLKLDFKDVYQQGMAFDTIMGNFQFDAGQMYTNNLEIIGPSASVLIAGSIDLINETYDQILSVSPRLDTTLPVAGAIAGGPAAGLVVLLAQQAFSERLQKIQRITYNISGSWDDPKLTRLNTDIEAGKENSILNE